MSNTFTQLYIQLVFAVEGRQSLIHGSMKDDLYRFMTGVVQRLDNKLIVINGMADHVHLLIGLHPAVALSDLVREVKSSSSKHINNARWVRGTFRWQTGFGAFSYSRSQLPSVIRYIENQEQHHRRRTFREEYIALLDRFGVKYDSRYLFQEVGQGRIPDMSS